MIRNKWIILFIFIFVLDYTGAQQIQWSGYMNSESINCITEDGNYLWLGTSAGLVKYDKNSGATQTYSKYNASLPMNQIYSAAIDKDNVKWFGTWAGLVRYDGTTWSVYTTANSGLLSNWVRGIAVDNNNNKWFATYAGIVKYDGTNWTVYSTQTDTNITCNTFACVTVDKSNNIWAGTTSDYYQKGGVFKYDGKKWTSYTMQNSPITDYEINSITATNNIIWIGTYYSGLIKFDGATFTPYTTDNSAIPDVNITGLTADNSGNIWISTKSYLKKGGVAKFDGTNFTSYIKDNGNFPAPSILSVYAASNGKVYSGTETNGLAIFNGTSWSSTKVSDNGLPSNFVNCILIDSKNNKWFGTEESGLAKYDGQGWTVYDTSTQNKLPHNAVLSIAEDNNGVIWAGTRKGIVRIDNGTFTIFNINSKEPIYADWVQGIAIDKNNVKWFASDNSVYSYNDTTWTYYSSNNIPVIPTYLSNFTNVFIDNNNNVWAGVLGFGAIKYDGTNWIAYSPSNSGLTYADVEEFGQDNSGKMWFGTFGESPDGMNGGIFTLNGSSWQNIRKNNSPLLGNYINSIGKSSSGEIWIGSTSYGTSFGGGLTIIKNPSDPTNNNTVQTYTTANSSLPYPWITDIKFDSKGNAWMGLYGYGVAIFNSQGISSASTINNEKILNYSLSQNYPNPFNPSTIINYAIAKSGIVTLKVYDILGREAATLVNEIQNAGNHSVIFNRKMASGIYLYKLQSGNYTETKKFVILK